MIPTAICQLISRAAVAGCLVLLATAFAHAEKPTALVDVVHLRSGGTLKGTVRESEKDGRVFFIVETKDGIFKLHRRHVKRVERPSELQIEYARRRGETDR